MAELVSIHAPARGATGINSTTASALSMFQSTLPRGERLWREAALKAPRCFNPRSRAGSDPKLVACPPELIVSIHAPARGATSASCLSLTPLTCFNPRSRAGSDLRAFEKKRTDQFQSTLPRGERPKQLSRPHVCAPVSIHAPARGATGTGLASHPKGIQFQSTLPRGERRRRRPLSGPYRSFNPRSRAGSDVPVVETML